jgi:hypothetical protein
MVLHVALAVPHPPPNAYPTPLATARGRTLGRITAVGSSTDGGTRPLIRTLGLIAIQYSSVVLPLSVVAARPLALGTARPFLDPFVSRYKTIASAMASPTTCSSPLRFSGPVLCPPLLLVQAPLLLRALLQLVEIIR